LSVQDDGACVLTKERYGALSLWSLQAWQEKVQSGINLVRMKVQSGRLAGKVQDVQTFSRLVSARFREVNLAGRGRLVVPEGFREFLAVKPGDDCMVVGAGVCAELWHPVVWRRYLKRSLPNFGQLFEELSD
jgi:MraZ protein